MITPTSPLTILEKTIPSRTFPGIWVRSLSIDSPTTAKAAVTAVLVPWNPDTGDLLPNQSKFLKVDNIFELLEFTHDA